MGLQHKASEEEEKKESDDVHHCNDYNSDRWLLLLKKEISMVAKLISEILERDNAVVRNAVVILPLGIQQYSKKDIILSFLQDGLNVYWKKNYDVQTKFVL